MNIYDAFASRYSEEVVLSAILTEPERLAEAVSLGLDGSWFALPDHIDVAQSLVRSFTQTGAASASTVLAERQERALPWSDALDLAGRYVDEYQWREHFSRLCAAARLRSMLAEIDILKSDVFDLSGASLTERLDRMETGLSRLLRLGSGEADTFTAADLARRPITGGAVLETGFRDMDRDIHGFRAGRVSVVAARPSHGKTAWCIEMVLRLTKTGRGVLYFSAEMDADSMRDRLLCSIMGVSNDVLSEDLAGYGAACEDLAARDLVVDTTARPTTAHIMGKAVALSHQRPLDLIVFDYLEYTGEEDRQKDLRLEKALIGCHEVAKRIGCPVVVVSQLNRDIETRGSSVEPQLSDIRYTGAAENIAAMVVMLYHEWTHWYQRGMALEDEPDRERFRVFVRKNTYGPLGSTSLRFDRRCGRFHDLPDTVVTSNGYTSNGHHATSNGSITSTPF